MGCSVRKNEPQEERGVGEQCAEKTGERREEKEAAEDLNCSGDAVETARRGGIDGGIGEGFSGGAEVEVDEPPSADCGDDEVDCGQNHKDDGHDMRVGRRLAGWELGKDRAAEERAEGGKYAEAGEAAADYQDGVASPRAEA